jgi:hypothetical protein
MFGPEMGSTGRKAVVRSKMPKNALICPIYAASGITQKNGKKLLILSKKTFQQQQEQQDQREQQKKQKKHFLPFKIISKMQKIKTVIGRFYFNWPMIQSGSLS